MKKALIVFAMMAGLLSACSGEGQLEAVKTEAATANEPLADMRAQDLALGGTLAVTQQTGVDLGSADSEAWATFAPARVQLSLAPPVHQSINLRFQADAASVPVRVQAASDGERLFVRLRWDDSSENTETSRSEFADGAAVQFALDAGPETSFMMGASNAPVNIWYWKAGQEAAQNLGAGGFGSTTVLDRNGLQVAASYLDTGEWAVVFSRPLAASAEHQVDLSSLRGNFGLALWQGSDSQRDGLKHVTMGWLALEPAP